MIRTLLTHFTYLGVLALLIAAGVGVPVPEDITLITGGVLAHEGYTALWLTMVVGYVGVVAGDLLMFRLGRRLGPTIYTHPRFGKLFTPERKRQIQTHFAKHGVLTVLVGRHTPGLRSPTFLVAGSTGMKFWTFFLADALSAVLTTPLVVWLGYKLADLSLAKHRLHRIELWAAAVLVVAAAGAALLRYLLRKRRAARDPSAPVIRRQQEA